MDGRGQDLAERWKVCWRRDLVDGEVRASQGTGQAEHRQGCAPRQASMSEPASRSSTKPVRSSRSTVSISFGATP
ncbi:hypothetical protein AAH979_13810 [Plantactinospora sp. ZYX-F-223]|uniref:hypothetical protein n=1 Tax=Plantactinospora sp. ZYX-F-223 TaxID=3144103 RepID=UPI0031FE2992